MAVALDPAQAEFIIIRDHMRQVRAVKEQLFRRRGHYR